MSLSNYEFNKLEYLLGKSRAENLSSDEELKLRELISIEQPSAEDNSLDELIKIGLVLVGIYLLAKLLE
jgi:hypothetical protein